MNARRFLESAAIALVVSISGCDEDPASRPGAPYVDHDEDRDFEPVVGSDGVPESFSRELVVTDDFFTASTALSSSDIQAFLENTPYERRSFLADEKVGGRAFSEVLVEVSAARGINPIMLLSRLQVEKSLVAKSSRPSGNSVDFAMGCGCPDNQPCNEAYRGIDRQLDCAADTLRKHYDGSVAGTGQWKKGSARTTLDPISVTPQSHATASLYAYTPWVLEGAGGNWLVWNITRKYAKAFGDKIPTGPASGFVGSPCTEDLESLPEEDQAKFATCEFSAQGEGGYCFPFTTPGGDDRGVCTLTCAGLCPDQGNVTTFCAEVEPGAGFCLAKASDSNEDCAYIPGTVAKEVERFVGDSSASSSTARVCWPERNMSEEPPAEEPPAEEPPGEDPPGEDPPGEPEAGSCMGACGSSEPVADGESECYCDESCLEFGDCCGDYDATCGA